MKIGFARNAKSYFLGNDDLVFYFPTMKTRLFKYIENFTTKNCKFSDKNSDIFHISIQNMDCAYSLELPRLGSSHRYPQSMILSRNKKNNVYPCKPQFFYKRGFKGVKIIYCIRPYYRTCSYKRTVKQFSNLKEYNQCTFIYFFIKTLLWILTSRGNSNEYTQHMLL